MLDTIIGFFRKVQQMFDRGEAFGVVDYSELPQFAKYDVENGFLLEVREGDSIEFTVDAALTYSHPQNERFSWAKILITFPKVRSVRWITRSMRQIADLDGSIDYGSIDLFTVQGDKAHLYGTWGEIEIVSDSIEVRELENSLS